MAARIIECQDCHHDEHVTAANAKRCYVCRLATNLAFTRGRKSKCWSCEAPFCPIARDDQLCGNCAFATADAQQIHCAFCDQDKTSISKDIAVCMGCARDIGLRKKFFQAVLAKKQQRIATAPARVPVTPDDDAVEV